MMKTIHTLCGTECEYWSKADVWTCPKCMRGVPRKERTQYFPSFEAAQAYIRATVFQLPTPSYTEGLRQLDTNYVATLLTEKPRFQVIKRKAPQVIRFKPSTSEDGDQYYMGIRWDTCTGELGFCCTDRDRTVMHGEFASPNSILKGGYIAYSKDIKVVDGVEQVTFDVDSYSLCEDCDEHYTCTVTVFADCLDEITDRVWDNLDKLLGNKQEE